MEFHEFYGVLALRLRQPANYWPADPTNQAETDSWRSTALPAIDRVKIPQPAGQSFIAGNDFETVSQFAADGFGGVSRLEKAEVDFIQLGNSGSRKVLSWDG